MTKSAYRLAVMGLLLSLMLLLGYIEHLIPLGGGIPGIKLGLANSVLLFSLYMLGIKESFVLMAAKVILSGFLFGGIQTMMYSFAGGLLSILLMIFVKRLPDMSVLGVSIAGAAAHNAGQILMAMLVLQTPPLLYYLPFLLVAAVVTGILTGIAAKLVIHSMKRAPNKGTSRKANS